MMRLFAFVVGSALAVACGGSSIDTRRTSCATDADCASGQRCTAGAERPAYLPSPCARVVPCEAGTECGPGEVCAPSWQNAASARCAPKLCSPSCNDSGCPADAECGDDGVCALTSCDAPGAAACAAFWDCDPAAAKTAPRAPDDGEDTERQLARGCVPDDCTKTKHCSDDAALVCLNLATHPEGQTPDVHGCIERTCDDGKSCSWVTAAGVDVGRCDYGAPTADPYGCIVLPCEVDADCAYDYLVCDHASRLRDQRGCRAKSCTEGQPCGEGLVCAPDADFHGTDDCAQPDPAMAGGDGGGGAPANGGSGGAAPIAGGGGTLSVPRGECVAR